MLRERSVIYLLLRNEQRMMFSELRSSAYSLRMVVSRMRDEKRITMT